MPVCKKCKSDFPNRIKIDGKLRNIGKRKYCLLCSPFGKHNTRKVHINAEHRICTVCNREFTYTRHQGHRYNICGSCCQVTHRKKVQKKAREYKGGKCVVCGYNKCGRALEFHHVDPKQKNFGISTEGHKKSWEVLKKELDKCVLVCANCHREIEDGLIQVDKRTHRLTVKSNP